jgi:hypothetical protein
MLMPDPKQKWKGQLTTALLVAFAVAIVVIATRHGNMNPGGYASPNLAPATARPALGFDRNDYPGDAALPALRRTFAFTSYWLNNPPGETSNSWEGKRALLVQNNFGFLILFNGRTSDQLKRAVEAESLGRTDARDAVASATREGFSSGAVIFLDIEEGGRMLPEQLAYILAWVDGVNGAGLRAGVYCSGMAVNDGEQTVVSAVDIHEHAQGRAIVFWVYNDACPPAPGCVYGPNAPAPTASGIPFASVWQFAQSPRRSEFTARCARTYNPDGNCYPPAESGSGQIYLDLDSADSSDPSSGRR